MSLKDIPVIADIRVVGLAAAIDLHPRDGKPGIVGYEVMERAFHHHDVMVRVSGDTIAVSPPLIITEDEIDALFETLGRLLQEF